ncbi:cell envelope integrity protein CreD [Pseudoxanthomonas daejeonensis]|uniref:cell envelope integrity protein CreD n=1 Tax=Pseudoxanthomonas daejeonensis TaxID=266062 RepID=UPI001F5432B8|nr:cell envelope integrity protein CreD [Pseudoxanthomonas daejeonensis]UNK57618.1 cell envelope integrity protein CreD [Pseudoxanthomonas daejeonensis]
MKSLKLLLRFLTVGGLVLLLLIPLTMIRGLIQDRERYRGQAVERVSQSMAGPQQLVGPMRVLPWKETRRVNATGSDGRLELREETVEGYLLQTPATLAAGGVIEPDVRRIGLYDVRVFQWKADVQAAFAPMPVPAVNGREYGEPYLVLGLADVRGLVGTPSLKADGRALELQPGTGVLAARMDGVHAALPAPRTGQVVVEGLPIPPRSLPASTVDLAMTVAGTQSLGIVPVADSNRIELQSAWPHPLFSGRFLPNQRSIDTSGFEASWNISSLASAAQSQVHDADTARLTMRPGSAGAYTLPGEADQGVDSVVLSLVDPVDVYTQADRASKYGILFVVLTFVGFALFELVKQLRIHPLQYLLVGLALAIFFLLLLGLSEHMAFWKAYLVAAVACIGLQFVYLSGVLKSWWHAGLFATMLTALYGALYSLLVSEDNALLMGSLLLFGILAAIMWITRKVDWYERAATLG